MNLLIFDRDGVLVDSEHLACATLAELMSTLGRPMTTNAELSLTRPHGRANVIRRT
jgi:beta-phosphoglucomutase-like phosphatase (HAD superfamily)